MNKLPSPRDFLPSKEIPKSPQEQSSSYEQGGKIPEEMQPSLLDQELPPPPQSTQVQQPIFPSSYQSNAPSFQGYQGDMQRSNLEETEALIESLIQEKWDAFMQNFGDLSVFKEKVRVEIISIKQEVVRIQQRFENMQTAILGKVKEYDTNMTNVTTEMVALEKVFQKIIQPLTTNVKELGRITEELKSRK